MDSRTVGALALAFSAFVPVHLEGQRSAQAETTIVVFVCEHGSVKSLVAIEYFNRIARGRHLPLRAISRGTRPDSAVPIGIREGLRRDGFDVAAFAPRRFSLDDVRKAALIVSFDVDLPLAGATPRERWDKLPAATEDYATARDSIRARVDKLVTRMTRVPP
jgi:arsenate reductase (thioredoxin)